MKLKNFFFIVLAGLMFFASCNDDDDIEIVDFGTAPLASIVPSGTIEVVTEDQVRYHVVIFGALVTSTIIETETAVTIVDVAFPLIPNSGPELRAYANAIGKPINVIITHAHQDHYGNMDQFGDVPVYAETANATVLAADANFTGLYNGPVIALTGTHEIGGLELNFENISNTEGEENGYLTIPSHKAFFPGDLIFNRSHAYIREYTPLDATDELDIWLGGLNSMKTSYGDYKHIFMGHNGRRSDVGTAIDENISYLTDAQGLIKGTKELTAGGFATSVAEVVDELNLLYPNYGSGGLFLALPEAFFPGDPGAVWF